MLSISPAAPKWHSGDYKVKPCYCRGVDLRGNPWIGKFDFRETVVPDGENIDIKMD